MAEFENRIKQLRNEKNIYQKELAKVIGVSSGAIAMYETGKRSPDKDILDKLASYFNVSVDYLLGRTNEKITVDKVKATLASDPDLANFWDELLKRKDLQSLYKQTKNLSPKAVKQVIDIIKAIDLEEIDG